MRSSRRSLLATFLSLPFIDAMHSAASAQGMQQLPLTAACDDREAATLEREAGPFFKPSSPLSRDLFLDSPGGAQITVAGFVLDNRCRPLPGSLVEIWHADEHGEYDQESFRLRGHQFTDARGRWWFHTIVPALYPGRTRHFHFKVQRSGGSVLTTQLFFPNEARNATDRIFHETLLMEMKNTNEGMFGQFNFVI
ncbi:intradiol ring-cleavage dioxygenase [Rhizobium leguminosarum bv. viciae]|nr:intradiol ring-cleavage dioxygenase [Rhizobium leguminosarum bv. viciae]NKL39110.1 intradiol ring-cleavage dioxygenase [Rhizobium leguminosarum bv. viciae]